jgi:hypothetical protein
VSSKRYQKMVFRRPGQDPLAHPAELFQILFEVDPPQRPMTATEVMEWQEEQVLAAKMAGEKRGLVFWKVMGIHTREEQ